MATHIRSHNALPTHTISVTMNQASSTSAERDDDRPTHSSKTCYDLHTLLCSLSFVIKKIIKRMLLNVSILGFVMPLFVKMYFCVHCLHSYSLCITLVVFLAKSSVSSLLAAVRFSFLKHANHGSLRCLSLSFLCVECNVPSRTTSYHVPIPATVFFQPCRFCCQNSSFVFLLVIGIPNNFHTQTHNSLNVV